tara:strand:- start:35 stop:568 length:534 start_codon:yes stop_codon:yes gene_type:complete
MFKKNIALIGMMAAGKTTIGFKLAKKLNYNFFDLDAEIEKLENEKIINIFQIKGEAYFRKIEERLSLTILEKDKCVISFGGGAFLNEKIRKKIKKNSHSFWLNWKIKTILDRITKNKNRPLALKLNNKDIVELYKERIKFYKLSDFEVNCENKNKNEIIKNIFKLLKNENSSNLYQK